MSNQLKTLSLKCPSCGAALEITSEMDRFACGFCGTEQIVQRQGGTVALRLLGDAISRVQLGTDRTAAELTLRRLREDMAALEQERLQVQPPPQSPATNIENAAIGFLFIGTPILSVVCYYREGFAMAALVIVIGTIFGAFFAVSYNTRVEAELKAHEAKQRTEFEGRSKALNAKIDEQLKLLEP